MMSDAKIDVLLLRELKPEKSRETDILKKIRHEYEEDEVIDNKTNFMYTRSIFIPEE